ncbi:MAG TPA: hypothetical protein VMB20_13935 [Candidatus Acidoferrum sp.]|nr:hypothetical protein [Candidatus Acidoferrum sp.]
MRGRALLCLLTISALGAPARASAPTSSVPAIVQQAAQTAALENSGVTVHERHITVSAEAGLAHFSQSNDAIMLMTDGTYTHIHYLDIEEKGRALGPSDVAKREAANNQDLERGEGFFKQPFDRHYIADYQYTVAPCLCDPGEIEVHFTSLIHDDQHGAGTMRIDEATGHVIDLTYTPNVLPDHANSGMVSETFGQALPGLWTILRIDRVYSGRMLFVSGHGNVTEVLDHFHHFTNAGTGEEYYRTAMLQ